MEKITKSSLQKFLQSTGLLISVFFFESKRIDNSYISNLSLFIAWIHQRLFKFIKLYFYFKNYSFSYPSKLFFVVFLRTLSLVVAFGS